MEIHDVNLLIIENEKLKETNLRLLKLVERYERIKNLLLPIVNVCKCNNKVKIKNIKSLEELLNEYRSEKKDCDDENSIKIKQERQELTTDEITSSLNNQLNYICNLQINYNQDCDQASNEFNSEEDRDDDEEEEDEEEEDKIIDEDNDSNDPEYKLSDDDDDEHKMSKIKKSRPNKSSSGWFTCTWPGCDAGYKFKKPFEKHLEGHVTEKTFKCDVCNKVFNTNFNLYRHKFIHSDKKLKCDWPGCDYITNIPKCLKDHKLTRHNEERRFVCEWPNCGKRFKSKQILKAHIKSHTDERRYVCDIDGCGKRFRKNVTLKTHKENVHQIKNLFRESYYTKNEIFKCELCGKTFTRNSNLTRHMYTHSNEKRFKCEWPGCQYKSHHQDNLKEHRKIHTDERPFPCDWPECGKKFRSKAQLKLHIVKHHTGS